MTAVDLIDRPDAMAAPTPDHPRGSPEWERLRRLIYKKAINLTDRIYYDFRVMLTDGETVAAAGRLMWRIIKPYAPEVLVGPGFGSMPLVYGVAQAALEEGVNLRILMVRDQRKTHNRKRWVEGERPAPGAAAVIIDDFMAAGSAIPLVDEALASEKIDLSIKALALFYDMWNPLGSRQLSVNRFPVAALYRRHDIGLSRDCFDAKPPTMKGDFPDFISKDPLWVRYSLNEKGEAKRKSAPVIADGAVFAADDHARVWRHEIADGSITWRYDSLSDPRKGIVQLMQHVEGSLIFGCYDGTVTRLDAADGTVQWRRRCGSYIHATPWLDLPNRRLFVNTEQWNDGAPTGRLLAMDWDTGAIRWAQPHAYWAPCSPAYDAESDIVVAASNDKVTLGVSAADGALRWRFEAHGLVRGRPAIADGRVYLATESGRLHCLDAMTGELHWTRRTGKGEEHQFLSIVDGCVLVLEGSGHVIAFDQTTGEIRWMTRLRSRGNWGAVAYGRYQVLLSRDGHLAVLEPAKERKVWEGAIKGRFLQPPALKDGFLAAAGARLGLQLFKINPLYAD